MVLEEVFYSTRIDSERLLAIFHGMGGTRIGYLEHGFYSTCELPCEKGDGSCRGNGKQRAIPQPLFTDHLTEFRIEPMEDRGVHGLLKIELTKRPFLLS